MYKSITLNKSVTYFILETLSNLLQSSIEFLLLKGCRMEADTPLKHFAKLSVTACVQDLWRSSSRQPELKSGYALAMTAPNEY